MAWKGRHTVVHFAAHLAAQWGSLGFQLGSNDLGESPYGPGREGVRSKRSPLENPLVPVWTCTSGLEAAATD